MSNRFSKSRELLIKNKKEEISENITEDISAQTTEDEEIQENIIKQAQVPKKRQAKSITYNMSIPLVLKNLRIPIELELAIKELKSRRNAARPITREKLVTEEVIIMEALEHFFLEPGLNNETMDYVIEDKMKYLSSVGRSE